MVALPSMLAQVEPIPILSFIQDGQFHVSRVAPFHLDPVQQPLEFFRVEPAIFTNALIASKYLLARIPGLRPYFPAIHTSCTTKGPTRRSRFGSALPTQRISAGTFRQVLRFYPAPFFKMAIEAQSIKGLRHPHAAPTAPDWIFVRLRPSC